MLRRFRSCGLVATALLTAMLVAVVWVIPIRRGITPPIRGQRAIASLEPVTLGGTKQWLLIRGQDTGNPLLLFLHGGPGIPTMYLAHDFQRELERSFVVIQWDRRGAGKSYESGLSSPDLSVTQEMSDTIELIDQLRARFGQDKVYLVGFSYGTYLGILVAQKIPERLAYIGIGQMACLEEDNRRIQDAWLQEKASVAHDQDAMDQLTGKKPLDREKWLFKYGAEIHSARSWWPLLRSGLRSPEYTFRDAANVKRGVDFTAHHLRYDAINGSILENVSSLRVPVYFFTGRFDYTDPSICTVRLFDKIAAPLKRMVWFEESAHFVFLEEPSRFAAEMRHVVRETSELEGSQPQ